MSLKKLDANIKINSIRELSFKNNINSDIIENFDDQNLLMDFGVAVKGQKDKKSLDVLVKVTFKYKDNEKNYIEIITLETQTSFTILDSKGKDIIKYSKDKVNIPDGIMFVLLNTAVGSTRGMFAYKIASLPINIVIPIVNVKGFFDTATKEKTAVTTS